MVFHALLFCILAEQTLFCCNPPFDENELQQIIVDVVWMFEVDLRSALIVATVCPANVMGNMGQLMPILRQSVP
jgi:hypothetical protein